MWPQGPSVISRAPQALTIAAAASALQYGSSLLTTASAGNGKRWRTIGHHEKKLGGMSARSTSGGATSKAPATRCVLLECAAQRGHQLACPGCGRPRWLPRDRPRRARCVVRSEVRFAAPRAPARCPPTAPSNRRVWATASRLAPPAHSHGGAANGFANAPRRSRASPATTRVLFARRRRGGLLYPRCSLVCIVCEVPVKKHAVFVDGQEGTTGLRIHEYLAARSDIEVLRIAPRQAQRQRRARPPAQRRRRRFFVPARRGCARSRCAGHQPQHLPDRRQHGAPHAGTLGVWLARAGAEPTRALAQQQTHLQPRLPRHGVFLVPRPLIDAGLLPANAAFSATSITGYSGGGKKMIEQYSRALPLRPRRPKRFNRRAPTACAGPQAHPRDDDAHGLAIKPIFMPVVGPFYKGLSVSIPLHRSQLAKGGFERAPNPNDTLQRRGVHRVSCRWAHQATPHCGRRCLGRPSLQRHQPRGHRASSWTSSGDQALLMARLDNLGKGASGAAVQCMNVHLGVDEGLGL